MLGSPILEQCSLERASDCMQQAMQTLALERVTQFFVIWASWELSYKTTNLLSFLLSHKIDAHMRNSCFTFSWKQGQIGVAFASAQLAAGSTTALWQWGWSCSQEMGAQWYSGESHIACAAQSSFECTQVKLSVHYWLYHQLLHV